MHLRMLAKFQSQPSSVSSIRYLSEFVLSNMAVTFCWGNSMQRRILLQAGALIGTAVMLPAALSFSPPSRIKAILAGMRGRFQDVVDAPERFRLQIEYAYPSGEGQSWRFESYRHGAEWTAPASTVKLPLAIFTLLRLAQLGLTRAALLKVLDPPSCAAQADELAEFETFERTLIRMLVLSDNGAYNRLYEFVGGYRVPSLLKRFGFPNAKLQARLGTCNPAENARGRGVVVAHANGQILWQDRAEHAILISAPAASLPPPLVGKAYLDFSETRINEPKDFKFSNHWSIADAHTLMLAIAGVRPHPLIAALQPADLDFLRKTMRTLPREAGFAEADYPDAWGKFLLHGDHKTRMPIGTHSTNKIGQAYGFLLDSAWLEDAAHQCVLSAVIYVNSDGVLNDDQYEYEQLGLPFLAELGRRLLAYSPR